MVTFQIRLPISLRKNSNIYSLIEMIVVFILIVKFYLPEIFLSIQERIQIENGALTISNLNVTDSGMFQCIAENKHGLIYSSAELKVVGKNTGF